MQTLRNIQGIKDTGHEWYKLLSTIFEDVGMVANTICKDIFIWKQDDILAYLILATDDILFTTNTTKAVHLLETAFHIFFLLPCAKVLSFYFLTFA